MLFLSFLTNKKQESGFQQIGSLVKRNISAFYLLRVTINTLTRAGKQQLKSYYLRSSYGNEEIQFENFSFCLKVFQRKSNHSTSSYEVHRKNRFKLGPNLEKRYLTCNVNKHHRSHSPGASMRKKSYPAVNPKTDIFFFWPHHICCWFQQHSYPTPRRYNTKIIN